MKKNFLNHLKLALTDPILFSKKVLRHIANTLKNSFNFIKNICYSKKLKNFIQEKPLNRVLFNLEDAWSNPEICEETIKKILDHQISLFGQTTKIDSQNPGWHNDLRLPESQNPTHEKTFSFNIKIKESTAESLTSLGYDIKYPWERSRLQHLIPLGKMYSENPNRHENLFIFFRDEINSWSDHNPFMRGVNWMNAMEVGIRATSLIWLFNFFYTEENVESNAVFWNSYINILWQHAEFINSHWENFDKPNNHYLLDLTGAWYLALFFAHDQLFPFGSLDELWNKICSGFNRQLQRDGTLYEGSTSYHRLIMQSLRHIELLAQNTGHKLPLELLEKQKKGLQFLADCKDQAHNLIQIGDNDSGFLIAPLNLKKIPDACTSKKELTNPFVFEYPDFGLILITNKNWHVSLRARSYNIESPRGHFHHDLLGITISYQGIPFVIDSGTGCYTPNTKTRNFLRSWNAHSTFRHDQEDHELTNLFDISGAILQKQPTLIAGSSNSPTITAQYEKDEIRFTRSIKLNGELNTLLITDVVESLSSQQKNLESNLIFSPEITTHEKTSRSLQLKSAGTTILLEHSQSEQNIAATIMSPRYGEIVQTTKLYAQHTTSHHGSFKFTPQI